MSKKTFFKYNVLKRFDEEKCCAMIAKILFAASPVIEYRKFMETWNIGTPESIDLINFEIVIVYGRIFFLNL